MNSLDKFYNIWEKEGRPMEFGVPFLTTGQISYGLGLSQRDKSATVFHLSPDNMGLVGNLVAAGVIERVTNIDGYIGYQVSPGWLKYFSK